MKMNSSTVIISSYIIILITTFHFSLSQPSLDCESIIIDRFNYLSSHEVSSLCSRIKSKSKSYDVYLRLIDDTSYQGLAYDSYYDTDNSNFLNLSCFRINRCSISMAITVYFKVRKIRITVGSEIDKVINTYSRLSIIEEMKSSLKSSNYYQAFEISLSSIERKIPSPTISYPSSSSSSSSHSFWYYFFLFIIFCLFILAIYHCFFHIKQEDNSNHHNNYNSSYNISNLTEDAIHLHMERLIDIVKFKVKTCSPPITQIEQCLICMDLLNPNYEKDEMTGMTNSNIFLVKFGCGHHFHSSCLASKSINYCVMCVEITVPIPVVPSFRYYNIVNEDNIFNVIRNFHLLYSKNSLKSYNKNYNQDMVVVREVYPSYTPGMFIWIENNNYNSYGGYGYDSSYTNTNQYIPPNQYNSTTGDDYSTVNNNNFTSGGGSYEMKSYSQSDY